MREWFVVHTQSRGERRAVHHLKNQNFDTYLPYCRKQVRHGRKTKTVLQPIFPGYVFVRMDTNCQRWHAINSTVGVRSLVEFGDGPHPIDSAIIETLRSREDDGGCVNLLPEDLNQGDTVRIREGALADYTALLEEISDEKRVFLLLDLMGQKVRVRVPLDNLTKAS